MKPNDRATNDLRRGGLSLRYLATIAATTIVVLFLLVTTLPLLHWFEVEGRRATLAEQRAIWAQQGIDDYRLTIGIRRSQAAAAHTFRAEVRDGVVVSAQRPEDGLALPATLLPEPATVEQLFAFVAEANAQDHDVVVVSYDEIYGFPRSIRIDPNAGADGDETEIEATGFDPRVSP
ncbi:MAG: DUF6174 domain-containing protein [Woeseiaceae bacterium]|nr:DUF6174 domain-containing protein [Woeseiaceae bacterium]